ncbi:MAG: tetratricopeptide repeat protein [Candidatus Hydrogenedentes bacterium]|nr:tetratricopeptide repeat protein [Candidatus Hydrogenedentota bacterium]
MQSLHTYRTLLLLALGVVANLSAHGLTAVENNELGIKAYNAKSFAEALAYFEEAYEHASDNTVIKHNLCNAHQEVASQLEKENKTREAIRHLELAIGIDTANPAPLIQVASYYLKENQVSDAIFRLEEAIELKPGLADAHFLLGEAYYRDNDLPSARVQWDYVLEVKPDWPGLKEKYDKLFREEAVERDFNSSSSRHFQLSYPKGVRQNTRFLILSILERAYSDIGRKLGGVYPPDTVKVILYSADQFSEATQLDSHVGALFDGKIRTPVTDSEGEWLEEKELSRRLQHEYVHVALRHAVGPEVPWWLNEGLAETLSRNIDTSRSRLLQHAYTQSLTYPLSQLEGSQLHKLDPDALALAYAQAHATVNMLWTKYGRRRAVPMLEDLRTGMLPEEALERNYRKTYAVLEQEVANAFR